MMLTWQVAAILQKFSKNSLCKIRWSSWTFGSSGTGGVGAVSLGGVDWRSSIASSADEDSDSVFVGVCFRWGCFCLRLLSCWGSSDVASSGRLLVSSVGGGAGCGVLVVSVIAGVAAC